MPDDKTTATGKGVTVGESFLSDFMGSLAAHMSEQTKVDPAEAQSVLAEFFNKAKSTKAEPASPKVGQSESMSSVLSAADKVPATAPPPSQVDSDEVGLVSGGGVAAGVMRELDTANKQIMEERMKEESLGQFFGPTGPTANALKHQAGDVPGTGGGQEPGGLPLGNFQQIVGIIDQQQRNFRDDNRLNMGVNLGGIALAMVGLHNKNPGLFLLGGSMANFAKKQMDLYSKRQTKNIEGLVDSLVGPGDARRQQAMNNERQLIDSALESWMAGNDGRGPSEKEFESILSTLNVSEEVKNEKREQFKANVIGKTPGFQKIVTSETSKDAVKLAIEAATKDPEFKYLSIEEKERKLNELASEAINKNKKELGFATMEEIATIVKQKLGVGGAVTTSDEVEMGQLGLDKETVTLPVHKNLSEIAGIPVEKADEIVYVTEDDVKESPFFEDIGTGQFTMKKVYNTIKEKSVELYRFNWTTGKVEIPLDRNPGYVSVLNRRMPRGIGTMPGINRPSDGKPQEEPQYTEYVPLLKKTYKSAMAKKKDFFRSVPSLQIEADIRNAFEKNPENFAPEFRQALGSRLRNFYEGQVAIKEDK